MDYKKLSKKRRIVFEILDFDLLEKEKYGGTLINAFEDALENGLEIYGLTSIQSKEKERGEMLEELNEKYDKCKIKFAQPEQFSQYLYEKDSTLWSDIIIVNGEKWLTVDPQQSGEEHTGFMGEDTMWARELEKEIMEAYSCV